MIHATLSAEIEAAARELEATSRFPASYVTRVRAATARLTAVEVAADDMRSALAVLEQHLPIDVDVPVSSSQPAMALLKKIVRKLTIFYMRYTGQQVTLMGQAAVRWGEAVTQRVERAEGRLAEIDHLRERIERLEAQLPVEGTPER
ncbi:MAG: hypothetical protein QOG64_286 [Acidimicrobiaceae bacterium]|nr:hypothetical protein [Acidimicrobiaceae bacterium]